MGKKSLITLVVIIITLGFTVQAEAYTEWWSGAMLLLDNLEYKGLTYTRLVGGANGYIEDTTSGSNDVFNGWNLTWGATYLCDLIPCDTIWIVGTDRNQYISKVEGSKPTGRIGTKAGSGHWYATCVHRSVNYAETFPCIGIWEGEFNYNRSPAVCSIYVKIEYPLNLDGEGSGYGQCIYYSP